MNPRRHGVQCSTETIYQIGNFDVLVFRHPVPSAPNRNLGRGLAVRSGPFGAKTKVPSGRHMTTGAPMTEREDLRALLTHRIDTFLYRMVARAILATEHKGNLRPTRSQLLEYLGGQLDIRGIPEMLKIYRECSTGNDPDEYQRVFFEVLHACVKAPPEVARITDAIRWERRGT
jgi:hypothetical protein